MANKPLKDELIDVYGIDQDTGEMRFFGTGADGSFGFQLNPEGQPSIIKMEDGLPQLDSINMGASSLKLGQNVELSVAGDHFLTEFRNRTSRHLYAHNEFATGGSGTDRSTILRLYNPQVREVTQSDESGSFTGTVFTYTVAITNYQMVSKVYFKTDTTAATQPVCIDVFEGTDDTGPLLWRKDFPASKFPVSSEIEVELDGFLEYTPGTSIYVRFTSLADVSIKTDVGGTNPWRAIDYYNVDQDVLLVIKEYTDGATYTVGDWIIDHDTKKIYSCNVTGVQTGTFASNSAKWDVLTSGNVASRSHTTGLLEGGVLSLNTSTTVNWTSGKGIVSDKTDPEAIVDTEVSWDAVTNYTPTNLATDGVSIMGYDSSGVLTEKLGTAIAFSDSVDFIFMGAIIHEGGVITEVMPTPANLAYNGPSSFFNFANFVIGPANVGGNIYGPNGSNLNIDIIGGPAFILGSNFRTDTKVPDIVTLPSESALSFYKVYREADPSLSIGYDGAQTTSIDPTKYDDGSGTLASVTAGYWTIQRIFRNRVGSTFVAYGQQEFISLSAALAALGSETFQEKNPLPFDLFRCSLVVSEAATDLSDTAEAEFFAQSSFRSGGAISSSSTIPGVTSPGGVDTSIQYNNLGSFGGDENFKYNPTTNTIIGKPDLNGKFILNFTDSTDTNKVEIMYDEANDHFLLDTNTGVDLLLSAGVGGFIGLDKLDPVSTVHMYESSTTGDATTGFTVEQGGTGDALIQLLLTSSTRWVMGIDNDDSDKFKIAPDKYLGTDTALTITTDDKIGIGTNNPNSLLHLYDDSESLLQITRASDDVSGSTAAGILFGVRTQTDIQQKAAILFARTASFGRGDMVFALDNDADSGNAALADEKMRITRVGNVGVGITPASKFHIYEDTANTGALAGLTVENDGAGDAVTHHILTGQQTFSSGIDNTDLIYKLSSNADVGVNTIMSVHPDGAVTFRDTLETTYGGFGSYQNLLLYSNVLDNGVWLEIADVSVTSTTETAPDGSATANRLTYTNAGELRQNELPISSGTYYISFWAKHISGATDLGFDLGGGTTVWQNGITSTWEQYVLEVVASTGTFAINIEAIFASVIDIWQLNVAQSIDVIPVVTGSKRLETLTTGALVNDTLYANNLIVDGPARSHTSFETIHGSFARIENLIQYSENLANPVWVQSGSVTSVTDNAVIGPDGGLIANASQIVTTSSGQLRQSVDLLGVGLPYTISFWAQYVSGDDEIFINLGNSGLTKSVSVFEDWKRYEVALGHGGGDFLDIRFALATTVNIWGVQVVKDHIGETPYTKTIGTAIGSPTTGNIGGAVVNGKLFVDGSETSYKSTGRLEVRTIEELEAALGTGTYNVTSDLHIVFLEDIVIPGVFNISLGASFIHGCDSQNTVVEFTNTGTIYTHAGLGDFRCLNGDYKFTGNGATLYDVECVVFLNQRNTLTVSGTGVTLGYIKSLSVYQTTNAVITGFADGLTLDTNLISLNTTLFQSTLATANTIISIESLALQAEITSVPLVGGPSESLFYINPKITAAVDLVGVKNITGLADFFYAGTSAAITLFADASVTTEFITSVTDSGGVARFNFSAPPTLFVYQEVVISGFVTNTAYNGTFIITATGAGYFEVSSIAFGTNETGTFISNSVTVTSATHGQLDGQDLCISDTIDYNGGYTIYNALTNTFQINATWATAETSGTWCNGSQTERSKYVTSTRNGSQKDSYSLPSMNVADNVTTTTTTTSWGPITFGTAGNAIVLGDANELFTLTDEITGEMRYDGLNQVTIKLVPSISMIKAGGATEHQFRLFKTTGTPAFDPHTIKRSISTVSGAASLACSAVLNPGDIFRPETRATTTGSIITITDFSL